MNSTLSFIPWLVIAFFGFWSDFFLGVTFPETDWPFDMRMYITGMIARVIFWTSLVVALVGVDQMQIGAVCAPIAFLEIRFRLRKRNAHG